MPELNQAEMDTRRWLQSIRSEALSARPEVLAATMGVVYQHPGVKHYLVLWLAAHHSELRPEDLDAVENRHVWNLAFINWAAANYPGV